MNSSVRAASAIAGLTLALHAGIGVARAQDAPPPAAPPAAPPTAWSDTAEFSYVATSGNSESSTLGFKNTLGRKWDDSSFELKAAAIRAENTTITRTAVGSPASFFVIEDKDTALSAESYLLAGRFDRKVSERFFWFAGAGWSRNRFSGIENRYEAAGGVGNIWVDSERSMFRTDYALSYTKEEDVVEAPDFKDNFGGFRFSSKYEQKIGTGTTYLNETVIDENLSDTSDLRATMLNSLAVAMSKRLALKVSLQWLYDHQPAFRQIDLLDAPPPGGLKIGTVLDQLDTLDTIFTTSLVVNF
jgi:putative salt-induced outer membrane protein YdiY